MIPFRRVCDKIKKTYSVLSEYKYTTLAGTLVFFLIMSLIPLSFWLTLLFGNFRLQTDDILNLQLFSWAKDFLLFVQSNAEGATSGVSVLFLITTLWSCTSFFYHLRRIGEIIYRYKRKKHGWKVRLSAVALTFLVLLFIAIATGLLGGTIWFTRSLPKWLQYPVVYVFVLAIGFLVAWAFNHYICPYKIRPSQTALGSFYTAIAWLIASIAFSVYLQLSNAERLYGALSIVIIFLLWLYWMMICFTSGVIFNRYHVAKNRLKEKMY
jgi:uncharacterized BrkB/YihY/UPF0761 family membrane protein